MIRKALPAVALAFTALGLAACGSEQPAAEAAPDAPEGISASNARLMLPAVAGNPAAVYFDIANSGTSTPVIRSAEVAGAGSAMMHYTDDYGGMSEAPQISVPPGETVKFEPGELHVMAMDLAGTVTAGSKAEVTLTFIGGDKISFDADVRAAGDER